MQLLTQFRFGAAFALMGCLMASLAYSADPAFDSSQLETCGLRHTYVGVTRNGTPIEAYISADDLDVSSPKKRILLVAGLDGSQQTTAAAVDLVVRFYTTSDFEALRKRLALSIVPCVSPEGPSVQRLDVNIPGGNATTGYPPSGEFYTNQTEPEAQYLWRWIGMHAPDFVYELVAGETCEQLDPAKRPPDSLSVQLPRHSVCGVGTIAAACWSVARSDGQPDTLKRPRALELPLEQLAKELTSQFNDNGLPISDRGSGKKIVTARQELWLRDRRSELEMCQQLANVYGHELPSLAYIPSVACIGRLRLAKLTNDANIVADIQHITADYRSGAKPTLTPKSGSSDFAGHILWGELFDATQERDLIKLAVAAADKAFDAAGRPLQAMPSHNEMSDAVFMGCPILAQAGRLTGDRKYFEMCLQHMRFMLKLNLRRDGLHRHSPLDESAWGRGNGFAALGLTLALSDIPADFAGRHEILGALQAHLTALLKHQDATGAWHQVIDHPESYRELTSTCMITYAMARGVRDGWLDPATFDSAIELGWKAIKSRVASDGSLVDVCTGTGKMKSLREYYDRPAILGRDPRGGAMALLVATEMAARKTTNP